MKRRQWLGLLLALVLTVALATAAFAAGTVEPFTDVPESEYYADPVAWAVAEKITNGTDDTHFSPVETCTRGQIVTFLYRAADEPEVKNVKNPFVDVAKGTYYENAVLWAVENEITNGTDDTHFSPNSSC
ncbi:MAG: S-layer homology domain-containing protein, partial [Proteobacteria bacterium]|nr:S-layer homology domain-containing protein [Pseudomonadota bacterium]